MEHKNDLEIDTIENVERVLDNIFSEEKDITETKTPQKHKEDNIDFNNDFIKSKSSDVEKLLHNKIISMAIYDENNELIYFGKKKENWSSNSAIRKEYKVAEKIRMCYSTPTNSIICFLPVKSLRNEE